MPKHRSLCSALLLFAAISHSASAQQPAGGSDAALIRALLAEVHALRVALEKSSVVGPRMQVALARYQMQQERVLRKERDLEVARNQIALENIGKDRMFAAARQYEDQARQASDPAAKKQFEDAANVARADIELQAQRDQQARAKESSVLGELQLEQAKLAELATQMDQLDKMLSQP